MTEHNEREMLEWAARAAGHDCSCNDRLGCLEIWQKGDKVKRFWQPHRDDGDCARLEAACGLDLSWFDDRVEIGDSHADPVDWLLASASYADHGGDKNKARRWASTLAAATLGKSAAMDGEGKAC